MYLGAYSAGSFTVNAAGIALRIESTSPILVTVASGVGTVVGTPPVAGDSDYVAMPPASSVVYGIPQRGYLASALPSTVPAALTCVNSTGNATTTTVVVNASRPILSPIASTGYVHMSTQ